MDKQEYREFLDEIKRSYYAKNYEQVAAYADELDFGKIKDPRTLEMISDAYDNLGETDNAIDALAAAFARNKSSKQTAYKLGELCVKAGDLDSAVDYYESYRKLANNNSKALLLKYEIGKAGGVPAKELVKVLEAYNAREKDEKWEYELARLYHETGQIQKCVETCDNIFLWYSGGEYVKKALELKFSHTPLSTEQQIRYEQMMQEFLDPSEMTRAAEPEEDEVARQLADEYLSGADDYEKQMAKAGERKAAEEFKNDQPMTETARIEALQDTKVIPISEIMSELDSEGEAVPEEPAMQEEHAEPEAEATQEETAEEAPEAQAPAAQEPEVDISHRTSGTITFEELRAMIKDGNRKQAQTGLFFTYKEPTEEEIAEEAAQKAARAEAKRKAEEEAARKAAEEQAAREAAAAAAREAARLEEEARVEAALRAEEEARKLASAAARAEGHGEAVKEATQRIDPNMEIDETRFINRNELLARLDEADKKIEEVPAAKETEPSAKESLGFTAMFNAIAAEVNLEEVTAAPPAEETKEDDEVGATQIFTREEMDSALGLTEDEPEHKTPQQQLGAAIEQIMDDANATVERDMEETKSIRIVLPVASANKLGLASAKLSQYASSVEKPVLEATPEINDRSSAGRPRIIDNVDFSYIPVSSDEDGQLGLNIEYLTLKDDFEVEGQLTIEDVMKSYSRKLKLNQAKVLDIESERLRKIQEAVNLTAPVKLPYSMDDLMFDDIEMANIDGNENVVEGDIFQFDPESIGVIPSDEELLAAIEEKEAAETEAAEEPAAEEEPEEEEEPAAEEEPETVEEPAAEEEPEAVEEPAAEEEPEAVEEPAAEEEPETVEEPAAEEEPETVEVKAEEEYLPSEGSILAALAALEAEKAAAQKAELPEAEEEELMAFEDDVIAELEAETEPEPEEPAAEPDALDDEAERAFAELEALVDGRSVEEEPVIEEAEAEAEPVVEEAEAEAEPVVEEAEAEPVIDETEVEDELAAEEAETEEEPAEWGEELSEADRAIAEFDMKAISGDLGEGEAEVEKDIDDELFDVMAELDRKEEPAQTGAETEQILEADAFEAMLGELMASDEQDEVPLDEAGEDILRELEAAAAPPVAESSTEQTEAESFTEQTEAAQPVAEEEPVAVSASGYKLSEESRERLSEFLLIDGMEQQIVDVISNLIDKKKSGKENAGNLIVTGDIKSGKTFLAIEMIKAVTEEFGSKNGKVAKVQADLLNGKNIEKVFEKIGGSDLIIENVGYLDDETIENLTDVISSGRFSSMVIIEGNQLAVESIFTSFPAFGALFENRIDISELSIVQWAEIAMKYADEKGFVLDDMAKLALHAKINEINVPTARLGYDEILDIMDDAIARAEKRNSGRLFAAFKKGDDDKREIIESDFM